MNKKLKTKIGHWSLAEGCELSRTVIGHWSNGFTIAEMLIVTIIIAILMSIGGRIYYDERDKFIYNNALSKVMGIVNTARNLATTSTGVAVGNTYTVPPSGYGVYINLTPDANEPNFTLFASLGGSSADLNTTFDKGTIKPPDTMADKIIETYRLPDQLHLQFLKINDGAGLQDQPTTWKLTGTTPELLIKEGLIMFRPPLADTYLSAGTSHPDLEDLVMRFYNPNEVKASKKKCQYISINRIRTFPDLSYDDCISSSNYPLLY
jgi:prepilin-type N-terminal cleavage/methylation domain-containing protein